MEALVNAANVLYLASYFVRDMLKLRILTVVAASMLIVYFYSQPEPLMTCIYWNLFFIGQNLFWIVRLVLKRRAAADSDSAPTDQPSSLSTATQAA